MLCTVQSITVHVIHSFRSRVRLSWSTHYVGDLRGVNNGLLDTYQLKSLDGLAEMDVRGMNLTRNADGRISIHPAREFL